MGPRSFLFGAGAVVAALWVAALSSVPGAPAAAPSSLLKVAGSTAPSVAGTALPPSASTAPQAVSARREEPIVRMLRIAATTSVSPPPQLVGSDRPIREIVCLPSPEHYLMFRCQGGKQELTLFDLESLALNGNPFAAAFWLDSVNLEDNDPATRDTAAAIMAKRATLGDASMLFSLADLRVASATNDVEDRQTAVALRYAAWLSEFYGREDEGLLRGVAGMSNTDCLAALERGTEIARWFGWDNSDRARAGQNGIRQEKCLDVLNTTPSQATDKGPYRAIDDRF